MRRMNLALGTLFFIGGLLSGCSETEKEVSKIKEPHESAKVGAEQVSAEDASASQKEVKDENWTRYNVNWKEDYKGLKFHIKSISVIEDLPKVSLDGKKTPTPAIAVNFVIDNTTNKEFTTYPDQATLITSTGEQVESDMLVSDQLGGTIYEGVKKDGAVAFYLERGKVDEIKWVKLLWDVRPGNEISNENDHKEFAPRIELKK